eukprot:4728759-Karenia_brevis.AAC.1
MASLSQRGMIDVISSHFCKLSATNAELSQQKLHEMSSLKLGVNDDGHAQAKNIRNGQGAKLAAHNLH